MAKLSHDDVLAYLEEASILELNDLVKAIEEKFGVTAAAPVAVAAAPAEDGAAAGPSVAVGTVAGKNTAAEAHSRASAAFCCYPLRQEHICIMAIVNILALVMRSDRGMHSFAACMLLSYPGMVQPKATPFFRLWT